MQVCLNHLAPELSAQCTLQKVQDFIGHLLGYFAYSWLVTSGDIWLSQHHTACWLQSFSAKVLILLVVCGTCELTYVFGLLTGVCWACRLCPADTEHVGACQNGQWANVVLPALPSHTTHTQPLTHLSHFSWAVISLPLVAVLLETKLQMTTSLLLPGVAAHSEPLVGSFFKCFVNLFLYFCVLRCQQLSFCMRFDVPIAVNIKITVCWVVMLCRLVDRQIPTFCGSPLPLAC